MPHRMFPSLGNLHEPLPHTCQAPPGDHGRMVPAPASLLDRCWLRSRRLMPLRRALPTLIPMFSESSSRPQGGRSGLSSLSRPPSFPQVPPTAHLPVHLISPQLSFTKASRGSSAFSAWSPHPGQHKTYFLPWKESSVGLRNAGSP